MKLQGVCPSCQRDDTLEADTAGVVRCLWVGCSKPTALWDLLNNPLEHEHIVKFGEDSFSMAHPLHERVNDSIMTCDLHEYLASQGGPVREPGTYAVRSGAVDPWVFRPL